MPARAGVFVITASIETEGAEGMVSRVFSIPVIVAPTGAAARDGAGRCTRATAEYPGAN